MRRIRKPKNRRSVSLLLILLTAITSAAGYFLPYGLLSLLLAIVLAVYGKNFWECEICGALTARE
jgi:hypothetical protein